MVYIKTALGQTAMQNRTFALTPRQRAAFIMFDGKRSEAEVMKATAGLGVTSEDVAHLLALALLAPGTTLQAAPAPVVASPTPAAAPQAMAMAMATQIPTPSQTIDGAPSVDAQASYSKAYPIATRLTAQLGLRGFLLNLAVEAAGDLDKLRELAPKIKEAVGAEKFQELGNALYG